MKTRFDLSGELMKLKHYGCYPSLSLRGTVWRAHINGAGNQWDEGVTPDSAFRKAIRNWISAGRPMDGYAAKREGSAK